MTDTFTIFSQAMPGFCDFELEGCSQWTNFDDATTTCTASDTTFTYEPLAHMINTPSNLKRHAEVEDSNASPPLVNDAGVDDAFFGLIESMDPEELAAQLSLMAVERVDAVVPTSPSWDSFIEGFGSKDTYLKAIQKFANYCRANDMDMEEDNRINVERLLIKYFDYCYDSGLSY